MALLTAGYKGLFFQFVKIKLMLLLLLLVLSCGTICYAVQGGFTF